MFLNLEWTSSIFDKFNLLILFIIVVLTGWETQNKYKVRNSLGQQVYFAAEG